MSALFTSPKRINGYVVSPDTPSNSLPLSDSFGYLWNSSSIGKQDPTPRTTQTDSCDCEESPDQADDDRLKRGRPRAESISSLIVQGSRAESNHKCKICARNFPREKSLQAHMRTHTGEKPYICDFPNCGKSFCQSGQLKTHQRLHSGEKPFRCSVEGCKVRFTHANRHCTAHPTAALRRDDANAFSLPDGEDTKPEVLQWLKRHMLQRQERATPMKPSKRPCIKRSLSQDIENQWIQHKHPQLENQRPMVDVDYSPIQAKREPGTNFWHNTPTLPGTPYHSYLAPKAEAVTPTNNTSKRLPLSPSKYINLQPMASSHVAHSNVAMNLFPQQTLSSPKKCAENQEKIMGALALMELANGKL